MGFSPEQLAEYQRLQAMTPDQRLELAEETARNAEASGNQALADALRKEIGRRKGAAAPSAAPKRVGPPEVKTVPSGRQGVQRGYARAASGEQRQAGEPRRHYEPPAAVQEDLRPQLVRFAADNAEAHRRCDVLERDNTELRAALAELGAAHRATEDNVAMILEAMTKQPQQ